MALAACCTVPMIAIIVLTSATVLTLGPPVAAGLGITADGLCIGIMVLHRRAGHHDRGTQHH